MGLLDMPLISEMDEIEMKAKRGDEYAIDQLLLSLPTIKQVYVKKLMHVWNMSPRQALEKAGILVCIR